jgi:tetratricopeptide (TPR) repeat protein
MIVLTVLLFTAFPATAADENGLLTECESLFARRDNPEILLQAIECYQKALTANPDNLKIPTRLAMCYYWKGYLDRRDEDRDTRREAYKKSMEYAQMVLTATPRDAAANFWYASSLARYGVEAGIMKSLFSIKEMNRHLKIVEEEDRFYYRGGPQRYRASLIAALPSMVRKSWGGGSLEDAEAMLKEAIVHEPNFAFSYLILADVYLAMGKKEMAREQLEKIADIREENLPEYAAEIRYDRMLATERIQKFFPE